MQISTTRWRVSPAAWLPIGLAIAAEAVSNALRAYGLGTHLDRFTVHAYGHDVSLSGAVLVLAAVAVSLTQARAAWVAFTPGAPARQRLVSGLIATLLLAISVSAMASHILEAGRAKTASESGQRGDYDRAKTAYDAATAELASLGQPRPVAAIQAEVQSAKIDMGIWRRSKQCSDISREETREACQPILALYKERGAAARKAELEPDVARLRDELARLQRPAEVSASEETVAGLWAWIMGLGVVLIATFGAVIFARVETVSPPVANDNPAPVSGNAAYSGNSAATVAAAISGNPPGLPPLPPCGGRKGRKPDQRIIDFSERFAARHGRSPTGSEIRAQFPELPVSTAYDYAGRAQRRA